MQYAKNILLKDFVLVGTGLVIEVDDGINSKFLEKRNVDKNRGSLVANNLLLYTNRLIYCVKTF